jgi:ribonuclease P/MRP protein subunit POP5
LVKIEKQRYVLFKIIKETDTFFDKQDILRLIWRSIWRYFGIKEANKTGLWLYKLDLKREIGIIRCSNETKEEIISALTFIKEINGKRIILSPIKTSGTIRGLKNIKN